MKYQVLFSLKNNEKVFINVACCSRVWRFKGCLKLSPLTFYDTADAPYLEILYPRVPADSTIKEYNCGYISYTVELQWFEHLWDHENWFETG